MDFAVARKQQAIARQKAQAEGAFDEFVKSDMATAANERGKRNMSQMIHFELGGSESNMVSCELAVAVAGSGYVEVYVESCGDFVKALKTEGRPLSCKVDGVPEDVMQGTVCTVI
jgi:hypothetical protein